MGARAERAWSRTTCSRSIRSQARLGELDAHLTAIARDRSVPRAGRVAALLPRDRHADRDDDRRGAARLPALPVAARADGVSRPGARRTLEWRTSTAAGGSRRRATRSCGGCSSKRPGITSIDPASASRCARRRTGQPRRVIAIADKAQQRLCRRFRRLAAEHKPTPKVAVAIARELAGFMWAALQPHRRPVTSRTARDGRCVRRAGRTAKTADDQRHDWRTGELAMRHGPLSLDSRA